MTIGADELDLRRADLSANSTLSELTELLRTGSTIQDPAEMLAHYASWFGRDPAAIATDLLVTVSKRDMPEGRYKLTRVLTARQRLEDGRGVANPWREWDRLPEGSGGLIGMILEQDEPQLITGLEAPHDPVLGELLAPMRACMATPHFDDGQALNWALQFSMDPARWSPEDVERSMLNGNLLGTATRNLVSKQQAQLLNERLEAQLDEVARVQRSLLPDKTPEIPGLKIATSYLTSEKAGGDYYDFHRFSETRWGIVIADVSGHGAAAATVMAMLHALFPLRSSGDASPMGSIEETNRRLYHSLHEGMFVTAMFMLYDASTGGMEFVLCGHPPARVRRADGRVEELSGEAMLPLGIVDPYELRATQGRLNPGDTIVMYTDGITEAARIDEDGRRDMFGVERLDEALRRCTGRPSCVIDSVHKALYEHVGAMTRDDDQTLVVIQREGDA